MLTYQVVGGEYNVAMMWTISSHLTFMAGTTRQCKENCKPNVEYVLFYYLDNIYYNIFCKRKKSSTTELNAVYSAYYT